MSAYLRPRLPGASLFLTLALADRGARTLVDHVEALRQAVRLTLAERPFRIDAWVVLPDHMHCVWTLPEGDAAYSLRVGAIKARFTRAMTGAGDGVGGGGEPHLTINGGPRSASKQRKGDGRVWQRRFWERHIRNDAEFAACLHYCWCDPVMHGLAQDPGDWPYSSWHRDVGRRAAAEGRVGSQLATRERAAGLCRAAGEAPRLARPLAAY